MQQSLANIQSGVELQIKQTIYDTLTSGPAIAAHNLQISAVSEVAFLGIFKFLPEALEGQLDGLSSSLANRIRQGFSTGLSIAEIALIGENAYQSLEEMYELRKNTSGISEKNRAFCVLWVEGEDEPIMAVNSKKAQAGVALIAGGDDSVQSNTHAEGNAFGIAAQKRGLGGYEGKRAVLVIDRPPCYATVRTIS